MEDLYAKVLERKRESKNLDFKEQFDLGSQRDWCEVVKDVIAISNTGGGAIVFGLRNNGAPAGTDISAIPNLDPADLTNKIFKYTNQQFSDFEIREETKDGQHVAILRVGPSPVPIVFEKPGTYPVAGSKQGRAFSQGSVYFRHGAKSEPGTTADLRAAIERRLKAIRKDWLTGIRKVVTAPGKSEVTSSPQEVVQTGDPSATPIRLSDDPDAPVYRMVGIDETYPFRQKEVMSEFRRRNPEVAINQFDILAVRRVYGIDDDDRYSHLGKFATRQYSAIFVDWLEDSVGRNSGFFEEAKQNFKAQTTGSR